MGSTRSTKINQLSRGKNTPEERLYAVAVEHLERNCPLKQDGPELAEALATGLEDADLIGVFSMQTHRGVALVKDTDPAALRAQCAELLPAHLPPRIVEVPGRSLLWIVQAQPEMLEDEDNLVRYEVLAMVANLFPEMDFRRTIDLGLETLSLRSLPSYLLAKAPGRQALVAA